MSLELSGTLSWSEEKQAAGQRTTDKLDYNDSRQLRKGAFSQRSRFVVCPEVFVDERNSSLSIGRSYPQDFRLEMLRLRRHRQRFRGSSGVLQTTDKSLPGPDRLDWVL